MILSLQLSYSTFPIGFILNMTITIRPFPHARGPVTSSVQPIKSMPFTLFFSAYHIEVCIDDEASVLKRFLHGMGYYTPNISGTNEKLEAAMRKEMHERKIQCPQLERTLGLAANLIEVLLRSRILLLYLQQLNFLLFIAGIPRMYIRREETYCIV